jgi:uncharacterized SAM-binding protein YcdF (DUF218 family)
MTFHDYFILFFKIGLALIFLLLVLSAAAFLFPRQFLTIDSGDVKGDVLVVLGGGEGRAERAAELYRHGDAPLVLVTGHGDCQSNIQALEHHGVPADAITAEPKALTTMENARLSLPLLRQMNAHRVIIVTSWYHSRRALACFEHVAPDLQFLSRPSYTEYDPNPPTRLGYGGHVNYEYLKLPGYWISYGVCPF